MTDIQHAPYEITMKVRGLEPHLPECRAMPIRRRTFVALLVVVGLAGLSPSAGMFASADPLPSHLTDQAFWQLSSDLSEENGYFRSDNLVSNEQWFQTVIPELLSQTKPGGVYLGVGPEQNFTYIAALKPKVAFITDIRRGNLHTHLMYKALFELSADRADFMSRLFTKKRPAGLSDQTSAHDLQQAYWDETRAPTAGEEAYQANLQAVYDVLTKKHKLPLAKEDLEGIDYVYHNFYWWGPSITYNSSTYNASNGGSYRGNMASFAALMEATDNSGIEPQLPCERGELQDREGPRGQEPARAGRRQFRRAQGASGGRQVHPGTRGDRDRVLPVERRAVPLSGQPDGRVLRERGGDAAGLVEHVHSDVAGRRARRPGDVPRVDAGGNEELRPGGSSAERAMIPTRRSRGRPAR